MSTDLAAVIAEGVRLGLERTSPTATYAAAHAPKGGVTVGGTKYTGGEFIPAKVMAKATKAEKDAVAGKKSDPKKPVDKKATVAGKPASGTVPKQPAKVAAKTSKPKTNPAKSKRSSPMSMLIAGDFSGAIADANKAAEGTSSYPKLKQVFRDNSWIDDLQGDDLEKVAKGVLGHDARIPKDRDDLNFAIKERILDQILDHNDRILNEARAKAPRRQGKQFPGSPLNKAIAEANEGKLSDTERRKLADLGTTMSPSELSLYAFKAGIPAPGWYSVLAKLDRLNEQNQDNEPTRTKDLYGVDKAEARLSTASDRWYPSIGPASRSALSSYTMAGSSDINNVLRGTTGGMDAGAIEDATSKANAITKALDSAKLPTAVTVYRGIGGDGLPAPLATLKVGGTISLGGIISTSLSRGTASSFSRGKKDPVLLNINLPKGHKAALLDTSGNDEADFKEQEVIFTGNAAKFRITAINPGKYDSSGPPEIDLEPI